VGDLVAVAWFKLLRHIRLRIYVSLTPEDLRERWGEFLADYSEIRDGSKVPQINEFNPNFIPRNYHIQKAIDSSEKGDFEPVRVA